MKIIVKVSAVLLCAFMVFSLAACGKDDSKSKDNNEKETTAIADTSAVMPDSESDIESTAEKEHPDSDKTEQTDENGDKVTEQTEEKKADGDIVLPEEAKISFGKNKNNSGKNAETEKDVSETTESSSETAAQSEETEKPAGNNDDPTYETEKSDTEGDNNWGGIQWNK